MIIRLARIVVVLGILGLPGIASAEKPEPVIRTFGFLVYPGDPVPDFLSEDSITVTVLPKLTDPAEETFPIVIKEEDEYGDPEFIFTIWDRHPAHYASSDGVKYQGVFLWLDTPDPPPVGSHTFTGPDSLILSEPLTVGLTLCRSGLGCPPGTHGNHWTFVPVGFQNAPTLVIVEAVFSK